jgi:hypothetical protein
MFSVSSQRNGYANIDEFEGTENKNNLSNNPYLGVVAGRTVGHAASFEVVAAVHTLPTLGVQGSWSYRYVQVCTYIYTYKQQQCCQLHTAVRTTTTGR